MMADSKRKYWNYLSMFCALFGIVVWVPNLLFQQAYSFWLLTFLVNPIGVLFGVIAKSRLGIITNTIMSASFFLFMFLGYLAIAVLGGTP
jgi:hypothetical protein